MSSQSSVQEFYNGKSLFVTGASGYVGKVLVEKLLRTCGSVERIYILLRPKKNESIEQRFTKLLICPIFEKLHKTNPKFYKKIVPIHGDVTLPRLGISDEDRATLQENVQIVIHSAATVKFNEPISVAMEINFHGARKVVELCKEIQNLNALVHISTAYTNAERNFIEEKVYSFITKAQTDALVLDVERMKLLDAASLAKVESKILGLKPNTYVYSKALVENYLEQQKDTLPITIVRPSIVTATAMEPLKGFVDNMTSFSGLMAFTALGYLRAFPVTKHSAFDFIPVDYLANLIIVAAWKRSIQTNNTLLVYNGCCHNPPKFKEIQKHALQAMANNPLDKAVSRPKLYGLHTPWIYSTYNFIFHRLRAHCMDLFMDRPKSSRSKVTINNSAQSQMGVCSYFSKRGYRFERTNVSNLNKELSLKDQILFPLFVKDIEWSVYFNDYIAGIKKYTLKEKTHENGLCPKLTTRHAHGLRGPWKRISFLKLLRL